MGKSLLPEAIETYIDSNLVRQSDLAAQLYAYSQKLENAGMCSSPEVGAVLAFLVGLTGTTRALEIGVFTGYGALVIAQALPRDGRLIACDISDEWPSIGRPYWERAGVADRIDLRIAPALETLASLESGSIDLAFIDADKSNYANYYEACLRLVRPGGLIVLDNLLWGGKVADSDIGDPDTMSLRQVGLKVIADTRVEAAMLAVGDGLMLAQVK